MILDLLEEATTSGARREQACAVLGRRSAWRTSKFDPLARIDGTRAT